VTHALSLVGDLFVDKGDLVLLPDKFWENYDNIFNKKKAAPKKETTAAAAKPVKKASIFFSPSARSSRQRIRWKCT